MSDWGMIVSFLLGFSFQWVAKKLEKRNAALYGRLFAALIGAVWAWCGFVQGGLLQSVSMLGAFWLSYEVIPLPKRNRVPTYDIIAELQAKGAKEIVVPREKKRALLDIGFSALFIGIAIPYFWIGSPSPVVELFLLYGFLSMAAGLFKRMALFRSLHLFYDQNDHALYLISSVEAKRYPLDQCVDIQVHTAPDILQLFHLFHLFSPHADYTVNMGKTWKLSFDGERVYLNPGSLASMNILPKPLSSQREIHIQPFYHPSNWKRLLGKAYFSAAVKGVGAYAALLALLAYWKIDSITMIAAILFFWTINLFISDRVLKIALDMKPVTNPPIQHIIRTICARAGLPHLAVYTTESSDYNGFAAGPYIGRSLIALTSETLKLPHDALAGVIAHEAVHVKKRDVLTAQLLQFAFIMVISSIIAGVYEAAAHWLETHRAATFLIGWTLIVLLYPAFRSWLVQWMEVRADHLGATLLDGGNDQMANALAILSKNQDQAIEQAHSYHIDAKEKDDEEEDAFAEDGSFTFEREDWFSRFSKFQLSPHPPMYWRIHSLRTTETGWSTQKLRLWWRDCWRESLPDFVKEWLHI
ncbi:M56 family metallopeptidase [Geobacillus sp. CAMR5420]|uniref:M56 family metallopeptidase n=1 Tax=Geobacillus sp. CAMR5420 TaxID=1482739 RepID=UPI000AC84025|nr:M56 family metallopeptidase [Geobacillus sp. CAMR5420]